MGNGVYFLPFTDSGKATELLAIEVKKRLGLGPYDAVDPYGVLTTVPARLIDPGVVIHNLPEAAAVLFKTRSSSWSAIGLGISPATGEALILLNPSHHSHRQRVSLMEEIVHIVCGHPQTELNLDGKGALSTRTFNSAVEDEAYCVGAACIIPYRLLFEAVHYQHESAAAIAQRSGVSEDYVGYRIKRAGLSKVYAKRHPQPRWSRANLSSDGR